MLQARCRTALFSALTLLAITMLAGCGGTLTEPAPSALTPGTLVVDLPDGSTFTATDAHAITGSGMIEIIATERFSGVSEELILTIPTHTPPYLATVPSTDDFDLGTMISYNDVNHDEYLAKGLIGSCQISISETSASVVGSFAGQLVYGSGSSARTINLARGAFNATY